MYRGRESVMRLFERIVEPWEYICARNRAASTDLGEGRYRVTGDLVAKHRISNAETAPLTSSSLEIRDGEGS